MKSDLWGIEFELDEGIQDYMNQHGCSEEEAANELGIPLSDMYDVVSKDDDDEY